MSEDPPCRDDLRRLQAKIHTLETQNAILEVEVAALKKDYAGFAAGIARLLWLVAGGLVAALVSWVINGGLSGKL